MRRSVDLIHALTQQKRESMKKENVRFAQNILNQLEENIVTKIPFASAKVIPVRIHKSKWRMGHVLSVHQVKEK